jgi:hypothetical protein
MVTHLVFLPSVVVILEVKVKIIRKPRFPDRSPTELEFGDLAVP